MTKNKGKIQPLSAGRFVMLWVIAHMLLFALRVISGNVLFPDPNSYELLHYSLLSMPINLLFTLITATIDFRLLRRFLRQSPRYWVQACMALAILSTLANFLIYAIPIWDVFVPAFNNALFLFIQILGPLSLALAQWFILRRYTRFAWIWVATAMGIFGVTQLLFQVMIAGTSLPSTAYDIYSLVISGLPLVIMPVSVVLMVMLTNRHETKRLAIQEQSDEEAQADIQRLADEPSDSQANEAPLARRRAQSY